MPTASNGAVSLYYETDGAARSSPDETVVFLLRDGRGLVQASLSSTDERVYDWAVETHDHYWRTAVPFEPERYDADGTDGS
jgi:hypothetical protein